MGVPLRESIRLFGICSAMNWCHLPEVGGIYDQHPRLLEEWAVIWRIKAEKEEAEHNERTPGR